MKKILKNYLSGLVFGIGILSIFIVGYLMIKARSGTTATPGDKLTASKWNEMIATISGQASSITTLQASNTTLQTSNTTLQNQVNSMKWVDVSLTDTTTKFDLNCERRWYANGHFFAVEHMRSDGTRIFRAWQDGTAGTQNRRSIIYTDKSHMHYRGSDAVISGATVNKIQKRCQN